MNNALSRPGPKTEMMCAEAGAARRAGSRRIMRRIRE